MLKRLLFALSIICVLLLLLIAWITNTFSTPDPIQFFTIPSLQQTQNAVLSRDTDAVMELTIEASSQCYLSNEPVPIWTALTNISQKPITVLKTFHFFSGNTFQRASPMVNGKIDKRQVLVLHEDEEMWGRDHYVQLLPNQSIVTLIPNFWDLTASVELASEDAVVGSYEIAVTYQNHIRGILHGFAISSSMSSFAYKIKPKDVWVGDLISNTIAIQIVSDMTRCGLP